MQLQGKLNHIGIGSTLQKVGEFMCGLHIVNLLSFIRQEHMSVHIVSTIKQYGSVKSLQFNTIFSHDIIQNTGRLKLFIKLQHAYTYTEPMGVEDVLM